jgi:hypothetical protein
MLRKFALVIIAVSSLGVATLTPTPASAWRGGWHGGWHGGGWGWRGGWGPGWRAGTWMGMASRLGMGRTTFRRGTGILRRWMCGPASCPWPVGTTLDFRE